jgi:hypothetical protein
VRKTLHDGKKSSTRRKWKSSNSIERTRTANASPSPLSRESPLKFRRKSRNQPRRISETQASLSAVKKIQAIGQNLTIYPELRLRRLTP